MPEREGFNPEARKIERATSAKEVQEYFNFADPILGVDWGEEGAPEEYTPEYIAAHPEYTQVFVVRNTEKEIIAGSKIKKLDEHTKQRLGLEGVEYDDKEGVLLEYAAVREDERKKGILTLMGKEFIQWIHENNVSYASAEVEVMRPISAHTMMREGFRIVGLKEPGEGIPEPYFVAVKFMDETGQQKTPFSGEGKEIVVSEDTEEELRKLFAEGWQGVGVKFENQEGPMTLILEKK